jgi:hypothetical protein
MTARRLCAKLLALLIGAPAAHAFTLDTIATPGGGTKYTDPADQVGDMAKGKSQTDQNGGSGFHFSAGPSSSDRFSPFGGAQIGPPPDHSRLNDR